MSPWLEREASKFSDILDLPRLEFRTHLKPMSPTFLPFRASMGTSSPPVGRLASLIVPGAAGTGMSAEI